MATVPTFTREQRDLAITEAMRDNDLRPRILHYVAAKRGISTGGALKFIEGPLYRQLGVGIGLSNNPTLGHVLDHLDNPHLDSDMAIVDAARAQRANALDAPLRDVFNDSKLLDRIVRSIALDQDVPFMQALEQLHQALDSVEGRGTLRQALEWTRSKPETIAGQLTLLDRRDAAVNVEYGRAIELMALERVDERGMVLLAQATTNPLPDQANAKNPGAAPWSSDRRRDAEPLGGDIGKMLGDPQECERRLARIRSAQPGAWDGDAGREHFRAADRQHAEAGIDLVRSAERPNEIRAAQAKVQQVGAQLDRAIAAGTDPSSRLRLLDAELRELGLADVIPVAPASEPGRGLRLLDADASRARAQEVDARVRKTLEARGLGFEHFIEVANEIIDADAAAGAPPAAPPAPAGDPYTNDLNRRVQARMVELGRSEREFVKTLEEVLVDDAKAL